MLSTGQRKYHAKIDLPLFKRHLNIKSKSMNGASNRAITCVKRVHPNK